MNQDLTLRTDEWRAGSKEASGNVGLRRQVVCIADLWLASRGTLYIPRDPARSRSLATPSSPVSASETSLWPPSSLTIVHGCQHAWPGAWACRAKSSSGLVAVQAIQCGSVGVRVRGALSAFGLSPRNIHMTQCGTNRSEITANACSGQASRTSVGQTFQESIGCLFSRIQSTTGISQNVSNFHGRMATGGQS